MKRALLPEKVNEGPYRTMHVPMKQRRPSLIRRALCWMGFHRADPTFAGETSYHFQCWFCAREYVLGTYDGDPCFVSPSERRQQLIRDQGVGR